MPENNQDSPTIRTGRDVNIGDVSGTVAIGNNNVQYISVISKTARSTAEDKYCRYTQGMRPTTDPNIVFGRQKELEKIDELIENCHSLAITGFRGTGKSTIASMYVDRLREKRNYLGIYWRRMNETTEISDVVGSFFSVIGKPIQNLNDFKHEEDQLALLFQELETSPYFLVLDNFETLINPQNNELLKPGLFQLIEKANQMSGQSRIMYTSWECPTNQTEWYQIGGLDQQAAMKLLEHIGITGSESELRLVIERSNGHPQALKLLGPLVKRGFPLAAALADQSLWKGQIAKQILDKVYVERLSEEERKLLQYVSLFREPVSIKAITALNNDDRWAEIFTTTLTLSLNIKSLLNKTCDNYWEESLIQSYVYSKIADKIFLHKLACDYYLSIPIKEKPTKKEDVQPLIEAIYHAYMANEYDKAEEILFDKNLYLDLAMWGNFRTLVEIYTTLIQKEHLEDKQPMRKNQSIILGNLGNAYFSLGDYKKAIKYHEQALEVVKQKSNKQNGVTSLGNISTPYNWLGDAINFEYYMHAIEITKQKSDKQSEGIWLGNLGTDYRNLGNFEKAIEYHKQALEIAEQIGDKQGEGSRLGNLGIDYSGLGDYIKTIEYCGKALDIAKQFGDKQAEGIWLGHIGTAYNSLADYEKAIEHYIQALGIAKLIGDKQNEGLWLNEIGIFFSFVKKRNREALACYLLAKQIREQLGNPQKIRETESNLKTLEEKIGEKEFTILKSEVAPIAEDILLKILHESTFDLNKNEKQSTK